MIEHVNSYSDGYPGRVFVAHRSGPRAPLPARRALAVGVLLTVHLLCGWPASAALHSGVYQTVPGATVLEWGDRVANGSRFVPLFATVSFDLNAVPPSLSAAITNAVLEGGDPFPLTVRSSSGSTLPDGAWQFSGDYLRDLYPAGTQYLFNWEFSTATNGDIVWNGVTAWAGGHAWYVTISNLTLVAVPWLNISRAGTASVQITWATDFAGHILEYASQLPASGWSTVTNDVVLAGDRLSVTLDTAVSERFYRLRKP